MQFIELNGHKFEVLKVYPPDKSENAEIYKNKVGADVIVKNINDNSFVVCYYIPEVTFTDIEEPHAEETTQS